jgi:hypothetical protein
MRRAIAGLAAGLAVVSAVAWWSSSSSASRAQPAASHEAAAPALSKGMVCSVELFNRRLGRCTRDTRATALSTNHWRCSVNVALEHSADIGFGATFDGGRLDLWQPLHLSAGHYPVWFGYVSHSNLPLPGGRWACSFTLGSTTVTVPFRSDGPTGEVVDMVVCAEQDTTGGACRTDQSVAGLPTTKYVHCNAFVTHHAGSVATVEFVDGAGHIVSSSAAPLADKLGPVEAVHPGPYPSSEWTPGAYSCRVLVDGKLAATKAFTVG